MCRLLNGARRLLAGKSVSQFLMTQKGVVIVDIGRFRSNNISHREIETQRDYSFRGNKPM